MPQYLNQHIKLHHIHFTEINELYISLSLQALSSGLVGIFVPIYLYNLRFSISSIAMFFILTIFINIILYPLTAKVVGWYGPKHIIAVSYILMFFYTVMLYLLPTNPHALYPAAIMSGIASQMFWIARHIDIATVVSTKNTTSRFSTLLIFLTVVQALAPLIGGVLATRYGIHYVFLGTCVGLLMAIFPLIKTPEPVVPRKTRIRILRTAPLRHMIANFAVNAQGTVGAFQWPLFIFLVVKTYQNVGIVSSASLLIIIILLRFMGKIGDHSKNTKVLKLGSNFRSLVHISRTFTQSFTAALGINLLGDITDTLVSVPYAARFYEGARRYDIPAYLVDMEIAGGLGKITIWIILLLGSLLFDLKTALVITFITAALLMPLLQLIEPLPSHS
ncbi:MAG TPA: MFS transporter [Candidatus Limnocylindrales bacterium]|nr:MFS transporter [Candidatus Limnocylindrales bacterium]